MVNEKQKYMSGIFRNIGFGLLTPAASTIFQWIVFKDTAYFGHFKVGVLLFFIGIISMAVGYIFLKEKDYGL